MNESSSCSPSSGCCTPNRRDFLRFTGLITAALFTPRVSAGPFEADANAGLGLDAKHPVPLAGKPIAHRVESNGGRIAIVLAQSVTLSPGEILEVIV